MGAEPDPALVESVKKEPGQRFASVRRGYDRAEVDDFLVALASKIEALETALQHERVIADVRPQGVDPANAPSSSPAGQPLDRHAERISRLGVVVEREVEKMRAETKAEAATILAEGRSEADRIRSDAEGGAKRSIEEARAFLIQVEEEAGRMLSGVAERRRQINAELQKMQEHLLGVARDLDLMLDPVRPEADGPGTSKGGDAGGDL
jgi:DivIVA domain-containing protein